MDITHSRLSFGQLLRRARRAGTLVHYRRDGAHRIALLKGGEWHELRTRPHAVYAYDQPDYEGGSFAVYQVVGGSHDRSSVTAATLRELGISVPR